MMHRGTITASIGPKDDWLGFKSIFKRKKIYPKLVKKNNYENKSPSKRK